MMSTTEVSSTGSIGPLSTAPKLGTGECFNKDKEIKCCTNYVMLRMKCEACPLGYYGVECEQTCADGYFGQFCRYKCECGAGQTCDYKYGCVCTEPSICQVPELSTIQIRNTKKQDELVVLTIAAVLCVAFFIFGCFLTIYIRRAKLKCFTVQNNLEDVEETRSFQVQRWLGNINVDDGSTAYPVNENVYAQSASSVSYASAREYSEIQDFDYLRNKHRKSSKTTKLKNNNEKLCKKQEFPSPNSSTYSSGRFAKISKGYNVLTLRRSEDISCSSGNSITNNPYDVSGSNPPDLPTEKANLYNRPWENKIFSTESNVVNKCKKPVSLATITTYDNRIFSGANSCTSFLPCAPESSESANIAASLYSTVNKENKHETGDSENEINHSKEYTADVGFARIKAASKRVLTGHTKPIFNRLSKFVNNLNPRSSVVQNDSEEVNLDDDHSRRLKQQNTEPEGNDCNEETEQKTRISRQNYAVVNLSDFKKDSKNEMLSNGNEKNALLKNGKLSKNVNQKTNWMHNVQSDDVAPEGIYSNGIAADSNVPVVHRRSRNILEFPRPLLNRLSQVLKKKTLKFKEESDARTTSDS